MLLLPVQQVRVDRERGEVGTVAEVDEHPEALLEGRLVLVREVALAPDRRAAERDGADDVVERPAVDRPRFLGADRLAELPQLLARLAELAEAYGLGEITTPEWRAAREPLTARLDAARAQLARASRASALNGFTGSYDDLRARWDGLDTGARRARSTADIKDG